jgi:NADPH-dependent ferric siderophore reductase
MGSRHRHRALEPVLIAGDLEDLPAIEHVLSLLPDDAYGRVFIETLYDDQARTLAVPKRVTVTWLARAVRPSAIRPLVFAARGEALTGAIAGWVAEWMPGDPDAACTSLMWIGCAASAHVEALYGELDQRLQNLHALPEHS